MDLGRINLLPIELDGEKKTKTKHLHPQLPSAQAQFHSKSAFTFLYKLKS